MAFIMHVSWLTIICSPYFQFLFFPQLNVKIFIIRVNTVAKMRCVFGKRKKLVLLETLAISVARPSVCKNSQSLKDIELTKLRSPECLLPPMISYCSVTFI